MNAEKKLVKLCNASEVSGDCPKRCEVGSDPIAVFELDGKYFAIADTCTHGPGSLSEGYVDGSEVECPFHQGRFDIRTGCATGAPCTVAVRTWQVHLVNGEVCINPDEGHTGVTP